MRVLSILFVLGAALPGCGGSPSEGADAGVDAPADRPDANVDAGDAGTTDDANVDADLPDANLPDANLPDAGRALSQVGGFGSGGASLDGTTLHVVDHGFARGDRMCSGTLCVFGGFVR